MEERERHREKRGVCESPPHGMTKRVVGEKKRTTTTRESDFRAPFPSAISTFRKKKETKVEVRMKRETEQKTTVRTNV